MFTYRDLTLLDAIAIFQLEKSVFLKDAWSLPQIKEELSGPRRRYIAALDGGKIIGYAGVAITAPTGDIHSVAVLPEYRRQGIARELIAKLEAWVIDQRVELLTLEMRLGNEEAAPLYQSLGYKELAIRRNYYGVGVDAIVMQKELPKSPQEMR
jgi:ribosomal-protein-alanine N-acetyltransferase